ncbi:ubiquinone biosynthesis protein COQ4, putative [Eimeria acervulina]|uniref:Ubiquinone biosynthesis protein COQ4, putative n=1 Tax=Eimeria acervulina TaxID=5801 RepID=U6GCG4_EIMAC|nr:ubiquinone biosynthesis protein COQ4, putative [Eimeria acervulina]CDI76279.1 ubiquinone biosynthesis protein COQ4, putative [Eimeria acervulina]
MFEWSEESKRRIEKDATPLGAPSIGLCGNASGSPLFGAAAAAAAAATAAAAAAHRAFASFNPLFSFLAKCRIGVEAAFFSIIKPQEDIHIALLSEVFAQASLRRMRDIMMEDEEGREVLQQRLLFDERFINYEALRRLPKNTLGYALMRFLDSNALHAGHRQPVRLVEDEELAYVLTRYRQLHDVMHAVFDLGITVEAEVALKLIEFYQTGLPVSCCCCCCG